jgi:hypothetical protein
MVDHEQNEDTHPSKSLRIGTLRMMTCVVRPARFFTGSQQV